MMYEHYDIIAADEINKLKRDVMKHLCYVIDSMM